MSCIGARIATYPALGAAGAFADWVCASAGRGSWRACRFRSFARFCLCLRMPRSLSALMATSLRLDRQMPARLYHRWIAVLLIMACSACSGIAPRSDWEQRLQGDAVVMLGEVHDNAEVHRLRLELLRRAFAAGWRPAIAMEQFDRERQPDIDRARRDKPGDAQHLIDAATAPATR